MARQLLVPLLYAASAAAQPIEPRADEEFNLFAYGHGLGGSPVVERNGFAYIIATPLPTNCKNVTFRSGGNEGNLEAHMGNATRSSFFAVPKAPGSIGFTPDASNASMETTGFGLYDSYLYLNVPDAGMKMDWYARPVPGAKNMWELGWQLGSANDVPVSLRDATPS